MVIDEQTLAELDTAQLREVTQRLLGELRHQRALNEKLVYENAWLKRLKFAAQSERHNAQQRSLLEEEIDSDLAAVAQEIEQLQSPPPSSPPTDRQQPKRNPLPDYLPRREIRHEPESTTCACGCQMKRIGEDVAQKLDYVPGVFTVERHVRGKWACAKCETITQAPVAAHVIDKGIPTTGLLAQVLVAKYQDHQPLYRQEAIFGRAGLAIPRSTLAQWVGTLGKLCQLHRAAGLSQQVQALDDHAIEEQQILFTHVAQGLNEHLSVYNGLPRAHARQFMPLATTPLRRGSRGDDRTDTIYWHFNPAHFCIRKKRDALLSAPIRLGPCGTGLRPLARPPLADRSTRDAAALEAGTCPQGAQPRPPGPHQPLAARRIPNTRKTQRAMR